MVRMLFYWYQLLNTNIRRRLFPTHLPIRTPPNIPNPSRNISVSFSFHFWHTSRRYRSSAYPRRIRSPNSLLASQVPHLYLLATLFLALVVVGSVFPRINYIAKIRRELNVLNILPWTDERTPRVYLYSSTDRRCSAIYRRGTYCKGKGERFGCEGRKVR